jgi:CubicO group peptidase (beta-lactamase class C family)
VFTSIPGSEGFKEDSMRRLSVPIVTCTVWLLVLSFATVGVAEADGDVDRWKTLGGEPREAASVEQICRQVMEEHGVRTLTIAVIQDGGVVFQRQLGAVDPKGQKPADGTTVLRAASLSKPILAYLVMKLVDEGVLELDKPLHEYLERPLHEYALYADLEGDERYKKLTARLLLSHSGGFPNWRLSNPPDRRLGFKFEPGERFGYSGEGYRFIQFVLEKMTGKDLFQLAREKVFEPLGMTESSFLWERRFDGNFALEMGQLGPLVFKTRETSNGAASVLTNAGDYAKFLLAVMSGQGLEPETHKTMLEPRVAITSKALFKPPATDEGINAKIGMSWALGWGTFTSPHGPALFHVGREEGCENYAVVFVEHGTAVVIQSVTTTMNAFTPKLMNEVIGDIYSPFAWLRYTN